ncbi:rhodanese-like domain-containing protein [Streptomyces sp. WMMB 322]|uniref:rhodanese-like domain-containing protein n=1 Tax=Streptomyces sp. WMMB 322 TaxID=1286821 RepID=UPI0006E42BF8|nr:rhodanese-like domain-containing protein [Streptomyces sp. WMMB 322]SCK15959.1 Rhodanese-related sulfurtransferase [Streptomyces sp. WMMB 322]
MTTPTSLGVDQVGTRIHDLTVIDVRTPGEYSSGHLPSAHNVPLDQLDRALPALTEAAGRGGLLFVCASGARSAQAARKLSARGVDAATLDGGTNAWSDRGHDLHRPEGARTTWGMERQVRLAAGSLVLVGLLVGLVLPWALLLSAFVAGGLVFSAVTDTCGMAAVLARLPHNRPRAADLDTTLAALRG